MRIPGLFVLVLVMLAVVGVVSWVVFGLVNVFRGLSADNKRAVQNYTLAVEPKPTTTTPATTTANP